MLVRPPANRQRQASSQLISDCIKRKYKEPGKDAYTSNNIKQDMKDIYGVDVSYVKAWRARELALEDMRGAPDESYGDIPPFLYMLAKKIQGSVTDIVCNDENKFINMFMAIAASIKGWEHCRPIIVVDGTFLKCKFGGTMIAACAQDASNKIFPLAFAIGDAEDDKTWDYFFEKLSKTFKEREDMWIVSDHHKSIRKMAAKYYTKFLGYCNYHLGQNIKTKFSNVARLIGNNFKWAWMAYNKQDFDFHMTQLDKVHKGIRSYLESVGPEKWGRAYSPKLRYGVKFSGVSEQ